MSGLGIDVSTDLTGRVRLTHSGAFFLGAATNVNILPSEQLGIAVLTNGMPVGLPEAVAATFMELAETGDVQNDWLELYGQVFAAMLENPSALAGQDPPQDPTPPQALDAYAATYANDYYGSAEIVRSGDQLIMRLGPDGMEFPLEHWDGETFAYMPTGENALGISAVTFEIGPDGQATSVTVEHLDEGGLGTFIRG